MRYPSIKLPKMEIDYSKKSRFIQPTVIKISQGKLKYIIYHRGNENRKNYVQWELIINKSVFLNMPE